MMYINSTGYYVPAERVDNAHFLSVSGLSDEWIEQRTGIKTRCKAAPNENLNDMGIKAIDNAVARLPYDIHDVDIIVAASYTPYDTVGTLGHAVQQHYDIDGAKVVYVSTACVSFINGLEIIEGYFAMGKAHKALLVCADHNTRYSNESDPITGHLWGDASVAYFISDEAVATGDITIQSVYTCGLGNIGKGPQGVRLRPHDDGITMPYGKDVFLNACRYSIKALETVCADCRTAVEKLDYIICHQGNKRIVMNVARLLGIDTSRFLSNIETHGNTGSASAPLVFAENIDRFPQGTVFGITAFGGGYACGAFIAIK